MTTQRKKQTPTETIRTWIKDFVTKPNPIFGDLPPCPFAQKAIVDGKVQFLELDGIGEFGTIFTHIWDFDFDKKDVLVIIADAKRWTPRYTQKLAAQLNGAYSHRDLVVMEDHPRLVEKVKDVRLNQGRHTLLLIQTRTKIKRFSDLLAKGDYYKNWSKNYRESVTGTWRHPSKNPS